MLRTTPLLGLLLGSMLAWSALAQTRSIPTLTHVHGMSYSPGGQQLLIGGHEGLVVFTKGRWSRAPAPAHDYMGFSATRDALYSSGHPAPGSGLRDPLGLMKSLDGGRTWQNLGLQGESDFHNLATSYETNAVYVSNRLPNSRMEATGIHYTLNDGKDWQRAEANGLGGPHHRLSVHPHDAKVVAAGTDYGLYLSRDGGNSFIRLVEGHVFTQSFDLDGSQLWFSSYAGQPELARIGLTPQARAQPVRLPAMPEDAVAFIAQNPAHRSEIAIATFRRSVFVSRDFGLTWSQIAREGIALP